MTEPGESTPPRHVVHVFATFVAAGPQIRAVRLMEALGSRFRHSVVPMDGRADAAALAGPGLDLRVQEPPGKPGSPLRYRALARFLDAARPDLLLTYNFGSLDAALAARRRRTYAHVHHEDGFNQDEAERQKLRRVLLRRFALGRADRVVVCSRTLRAAALGSWRLDAARVVLIENGIHTERFRPGREPSLRAELGIAGDALVVGSVGHLRPVKNFARLIAACAAIAGTAAGRAVHLLVAGDGEERDALARLAARHPPPGGRVWLIGHRADLGPVYRAMDVFALTSNSEQHPVALLEAMCAGLPVATTDVGDVRAILPEAQARYLTPSDAQAERRLARSFDELLADAALRRRLGDLNRARILERYTFERMLGRYGTVYEEALAAAAAAAAAH